ncbi:hypothetical protein Bbelb_053750 [Branchiostoma belcheri]|nr:hypothetical protein Bbelb_053750 [Branchiostoma belcheri]
MTTSWISSSSCGVFHPDGLFLVRRYGLYADGYATQGARGFFDASLICLQMIGYWGWRDEVDTSVSAPAGVHPRHPRKNADRRQRVAVNGQLSSWKDVTSGVPQGGVLSPYLFLVYMSTRYPPTTNIGYADDIGLSRCIPCASQRLHYLRLLPKGSMPADD